MRQWVLGPGLLFMVFKDVNFDWVGGWPPGRKHNNTKVLEAHSFKSTLSWPSYDQSKATIRTTCKRMYKHNRKNYIDYPSSNKQPPETTEPTIWTHTIFRLDAVAQNKQRTTMFLQKYTTTAYLCGIPHIIYTQIQTFKTLHLFCKQKKVSNLRTISLNNLCFSSNLKPLLHPEVWEQLQICPRGAQREPAAAPREARAQRQGGGSGGASVDCNAWHGEGLENSTRNMALKKENTVLFYGLLFFCALLLLFMLYVFVLLEKTLFKCWVLWLFHAYFFVVDWF